MTALGKNRSMPTDAAVAKFLYTIMKQLNLKSIDWDAVATELQITNGHAARMRYSRFKAQMEGTVPTTRKPRASGSRKRKENEDEEADSDKKPKKTKGNKKGKESKDEVTKSDDAAVMNHFESSTPFIKSESGERASLPEVSLKPEPMVKQEPGTNSTVPKPVDKETSTTEGSFMRSSLEPLPDFFSSAEELRASAVIDPILFASAAIDPALLAMDTNNRASMPPVASSGTEGELGGKAELQH